MAHDKIWPKKWNVYSNLPDYQIKFNVDTASGLVFGFLVAQASESDPRNNHIHYWYNRASGEAGYQMKAGNTKFKSAFSDYVIEDIKKKLPSLLMS